MIKPEVLDAMVAAGCTAEQIAAVVKADQGTSSGAARQARYRARQASLRDERDVTSVTVTHDVSPKEKSPTPPKEITPSDIPPATPKGVSAPKATPRSELASVLSPVQADAVIAHRQRLGKPMTAHAAHLLANKFAQCPSPDAAADAMIANGWQGFEPSWMKDRNRTRGGPAAGRAGPADHFRNFVSESNGQERDDRGGGGDWDDAPGIPIRTIEHHG